MWLTLTNDWLKVSYFQVWPLGSCLLSAKNWMTLGLGTSLSILKSESCHNSVEQKKMMITRPKKLLWRSGKTRSNALEQGDDESL